MTSLGTLAGFALFAVYMVVGLAMLAGFMVLYTWATPYDEARDIKAGQLAPAIALSGAMIGFTCPILVASYTHAAFTDFLIWGVIAGCVQLAVYWTLYWLLPRVIETNNAAGALCFAAASICAGLINAASFVP